MQTRNRHKMTGEGGGASEWSTLFLLSPPPTSVLRLKRTSWYMSDHYICQQYLWFLSLIFHLCWLWRNRELVWEIVCFRFSFFPTRSLRLQGSEHLSRPCEHLSSNTSSPALKLKTIFQRRHCLLAWRVTAFPEKKFCLIVFCGRYEGTARLPNHWRQILKCQTPLTLLSVVKAKTVLLTWKNPNPHCTFSPLVGCWTGVRAKSFFSCSFLMHVVQIANHQ